MPTCLDALRAARLATRERHPPPVVTPAHVRPRWLAGSSGIPPTPLLRTRDEHRRLLAAASRHLPPIPTLWQPVLIVLLFTNSLLIARGALTGAGMVTSVGLLGMLVLLVLLVVLGACRRARRRDREQAVLDQRLCFGCGHPLVRPDQDHNSLTCPECGFTHSRIDHDCPDGWRREPSWRSAAAIVRPSLAMPPFPPPPGAGDVGPSRGSIVVSRLRDILRLHRAKA